MKLSENFTLEELCRTSTGLLNRPGMIEQANLKTLAVSLLQPIRDKWGAVKISSGFRSEAVNKAVGGKAGSQHMDGAAADIIPIQEGSTIEDVFDWIASSGELQFGQAILEKVDGRSWIHISLPRSSRPNQAAMTYDGKDYKAYA